MLVLYPGRLPAAIRDEVERCAVQYRFFHSHLEFPEVFRRPRRPETPDNPACGWDGGFELVLGDPPWEHTELKEKEWFASGRPDIAVAGTGAARKRSVEDLRRQDPELFRLFEDAKHEHDGVGHFVGASGKFPLCGRGRINTYAIFAEAVRDLLTPSGRAGIIVPSGIATDDTTKYFFSDLVETGTLASLFDFENRDAISPGVHRSYKFSLVSMRGTTAGAAERTAAASFVFFALETADLCDSDRRFFLEPADFALLNPNTRTCPIFRTRRDAEITMEIYRRVPVLIREGEPDGNPWDVSFKQELFNVTSDGDLFRTHTQLENDGWALTGNRFVRTGGGRATTGSSATTDRAPYAGLRLRRGCGVGSSGFIVTPFIIWRGSNGCS